MISLTGLPLPLVVALFAVAAGVVLIAGLQLTRMADRFADVTGLGEALTGAVALGAVTSLAGSVTSVVAAASGRPELAVANALGGIAAQTVFLAVADITYRKINLEHAAASVENLLNGSILIVMISGVMLATIAPPVTIFGIHPATPLLLLFYIAGLRLSLQARREPMWLPSRTTDTRPDIPDEEPSETGAILPLALSILGLGVSVGIAGAVIAEAGGILADRTMLGEGMVGALFTAIATSTPELVTTIVAVRRGALTLAVSGIIGGNTFDVLFIAFSDMAYTEGSIYHAVSASHGILAMLGLIMTGLLLMGLIVRERRGPGNIGFESLLMGIAYIAGIAIIAAMSASPANAAPTAQSTQTAFWQPIQLNAEPCARPTECSVPPPTEAYSALTWSHAQSGRRSSRARA